MYSEYYREEGKTSKSMVKEITNRTDLEYVVGMLKDHHIGGYLTGDGHVFVRVGCGPNSAKASVCKALGFKYVAGAYWDKAYSSGVISLRELAY